LLRVSLVLASISTQHRRAALGGVEHHALIRGVTEELVAISLPVPAQRFYGREQELAQALLAWVQKVNAWSKNR
jgi:hypothetical protein